MKFETPNLYIQSYNFANEDDPKNFVPVKNYNAVITIAGTQQGSFLTWSASWNNPLNKEKESEEFETIFTNVMGNGLKILAGNN